jgi:Signal peptidase, peptidase S26
MQGWMTRLRGRTAIPRLVVNPELPDVPQDSYVVLSENRPGSLDSHFGWFVPVDNLVGRAFGIELQVGDAYDAIILSIEQKPRRVDLLDIGPRG